MSQSSLLYYCYYCRVYLSFPQVHSTLQRMLTLLKIAYESISQRSVTICVWGDGKEHVYFQSDETIQAALKILQDWAKELHSHQQ